MKVKIIKSFVAGKGRSVSIGSVLEARYLPDGNLISFNRPYQVIDGEFSGAIIPPEFAIETEKEKAYTEKEWNDMKNHFSSELEIEKAKLARSYEAVNHLTLQLCKENEEIKKLNFYLEALTKGLAVAGDAIREMSNNRN